MKKIILASLFSLPLIYSCSKSDSSPATLQQKWKIKSIRLKASIAGITLTDTTVQANPSSYMDFRADGKVYSYTGELNGPLEHDTAIYTLNGNKLTMISENDMDTIKVEVQNLSNSGCTLYGNETVNNMGTSIKGESWINLSK